MASFSADKMLLPLPEQRVLAAICFIGNSRALCRIINRNGGFFQRINFSVKRETGVRNCCGKANIPKTPAAVF
ncbi:MAG: hypothetical protein NC041_04970 [Bacteroides sp.]|nr:hypothetical protein [Bacteroides sp.]